MRRVVIARLDDGIELVSIVLVEAAVNAVRLVLDGGLGVVVAPGGKQRSTQCVVGRGNVLDTTKSVVREPAEARLSVGIVVHVDRFVPGAAQDVAGRASRIGSVPGPFLHIASEI